MECGNRGLADDVQAFGCNTCDVATVAYESCFSDRNYTYLINNVNSKCMFHLVLSQHMNGARHGTELRVSPPSRCCSNISTVAYFF